MQISVVSNGNKQLLLWATSCSHIRIPPIINYLTMFKYISPTLSTVCNYIPLPRILLQMKPQNRTKYRLNQSRNNTSKANETWGTLISQGLRSPPWTAAFPVQVRSWTAVTSLSPSFPVITSLSVIKNILGNETKWYEIIAWHIRYIKQSDVLVSY